MIKKKILITGATGFIGSHIVEKFTKQGHSVVCLVRDGSDLSFLKTLPVELRSGDITDVEALESQSKGMDGVIHVAAHATDWGDWETFEAVNITGTMNVLQACLKHNISRIIMTGSISSYGEENSSKIKNENDPFNSHYPYFLDSVFPCKMNYYRDSKAVATQKAIAFAKENDLSLTILEPVWVYGEREFHTGFYEYLKDVKGGLPVVPGSKKNKFHVVYAGDVADAFYLAFQKKLTGINRMIIGNRQAVLMETIWNRFCGEAGLKKPPNFPKWILYPLAFKLEWLYTVFRTRRPPFLTRGRLNMFYDNIEYDTSKAEQLIGFSGKTSLTDGIIKTVNWYKQNGYL